MEERMKVICPYTSEGKAQSQARKRAEASKITLFQWRVKKGAFTALQYKLKILIVEEIAIRMVTFLDWVLNLTVEGRLTKPYWAWSARVGA